MIIATILCLSSVAQKSEPTDIKELGKFIIINLKAKTSLSDIDEKVIDVEKVIIKKDIVTSVVIRKKKPNKKRESVSGYSVIITTTEKIVQFKDGIDAKAMANVQKVYDISFKDMSEAEQFVIRLIEMCNNI
jgi:hypothetical protein